MTTEQWRDVVGYEGIYMVSDHGRCARQMKPSKHRDGYTKTSFKLAERTRYTSVHVLVAETFLGPKPKDFQVNHKDGNKANNCIDNLEYASVADNARHAIRFGLRATGEAINTAKLTAEQVIEIRQLRDEESYSCGTIAVQFGVQLSTIARIVNGTAWKQIDTPAETPIPTIARSNEEWQPVIGWENYLISSHGRVAHLLSLSRRADDYLRIQLQCAGKSRSVYVHTLVAKAFLPDYSDNLLISHRDGDRSNNRVNNLFLITTSERNQRTIERFGSQPGVKKGADNNMAKLTESTVREIRQLYASGEYSCRKLGERFGVTKQTVWHIVKQKTWQHVE